MNIKIRDVMAKISPATIYSINDNFLLGSRYMPLKILYFFQFTNRAFNKCSIRCNNSIKLSAFFLLLIISSNVLKLLEWTLTRLINLNITSEELVSFYKFIQKVKFHQLVIKCINNFSEFLNIQVS